MELLLRAFIFCLLVIFYILYGVWFVVLIVRGRDNEVKRK